MTKPEFTPGPLLVSSGAFTLVMDLRGTVIANLTPIHPAKSQKECLANAALFAVSPDLYRELTKLVRIIRDEYPKDQADDLVAAAEEALVRAIYP